MSENNSTKDYNESVRANLPSGMTYNSDVNRYQINNHSFFNFKNANWYYQYITKYGYSSAPALSVYAVAGFEPDFVLDFEQDYYRTGGSVSTFDDAVTHYREKNATMVDSDGLLKWAPHNLITYSTDLENAVWDSTADCTVTGGQTDFNGGTEAVLITSTASYGRIARASAISADGNLHTRTIFVKKGTASNVFVSFHNTATTAYMRFFNLDTLAITGSAGTDPFINDVGDGWYEIGFMQAATSTTTSRLGFGVVTSGESAYFYAPHIYRSDLGGMVDNPDTGDSYVPTTSAARFLARRGNHVYNGTEWINEGYLHESEARTNLVPYSEAFDNAAWSGGATHTADQIGPDGVANSAYTLTDTSSVQLDGLTETVSCPDDTIARTFSVFLKKTTSAASFPGITILYSGGTVINAGLTVNTDTGVVTARTGGGTAAPDSFRVQDFGDYWRASITVSNNGTGNTSVAGIIFPSVNSDGDGAWDEATLTGSCVAYGAQLEAASTPSSYIPTSGSTVTRAADTLTAASANLPWPTPVVIGDELVTNGTFDTDVTGWTDASSAGGAIAWNASGYLNLVNTTGAATARQSITTVAAKVYAFEVEHVASTAGSIQVFVGSTAGNSDILALNTVLAGSTGVFFFVASGTTSHLTFRNVNAGTCTIDNISVREINPLAVSIQMDGTMTYADEQSTNTANLVNWTADNANFIRWVLHTTTVGSAIDDSINIWQRASNVDDIVNTGVDSFTGGINVPFNIASRHGSTFINGAVDGTALTVNPTPVALPDLSATDLSIAPTYMGNIGKVRIWADDLGDAGIALGSATAPVITGLPTIGVS